MLMMARRLVRRGAGRRPGSAGSARSAIAVGSVAAGSLLRSVPALAALVGGSVLVGLGIGVAGVLITGVVKEHLPDRAGAVSGGYVVSMMVGATVSRGGRAARGRAGRVVAVAGRLGGAGRAGPRRVDPGRPAHGAGARDLDPPSPAATGGPAPWRDPFARRVACYLVGASGMFYGWLTWLSPSTSGTAGVPALAGLLLAVWSVAQIPAALLMPGAAERRRRLRFWAFVATASGAVGHARRAAHAGARALAPWLWAVLIGVGVGSGFPLGLAVIAWRTPDAARSAAVGGLALGIGYLAAGLAPLLMGLLVDASGYPAAIGLLLLFAVIQATAVWRLGDRPRNGDAPTPDDTGTGAGATGARGSRSAR